MFTPQRKGWSLAPRTTAERKKSPLRGSGSRGGSGRGKSLAEAGGSLPPPPKDLLGENGCADVGGADGEADVWRKFKEAGMLDEAEMERKDREALFEKIERLESELYDYQYNMGLLLIEKKDWSAKYEELNQRLLEADEMLKREKAASLVAKSETERREENLKKSLDVEKQCVSDLEKAIREMRAGQAEVKLTSDQKLADAHALMANIEEKSLEAEVKLRSADAKVAEASRKSAEVERKSQEVSSRERVIQREYASLNAEKESLLEDVARQREELRVWEKSLQDSRERLVEGQNFLNQREKRVNENEKNLLKKEKELDTMRDSLEKKDKSLKEKEDYINVRLTALVDKEKESEVVTMELERKEKYLLDLEQKLATREEVELKKLLDEHDRSLASKRHEFEIEMETKRKSLEGELKDKLKSVEKKEKEVLKKEEQLIKREQALEKKAEKLKDDQQKHNLLSKDLKTREEASKAKDTELQKKINQISEDSQQLQALIAKNDALKEAIESEKASLVVERENLKIVDQERAEFVELQSRLKQEIEDYRVLKDTLVREREELRKERENFEREWEVLDDKRAALTVMEKQINDEKSALEKWKHNEEEKMKIGLQESRNQIQRELEEIKFKKEAFEETMKHERSQALDQIQQERDDMVRQFETQKHQLEIDMRVKFEESENQLESEVAKFNELKETEMKQISSSRESIAVETQRLKAKKDEFEREKQEYLLQRNKHEEAQNEILTDVETLKNLSSSLKIRREELIKEKESFLAVVEKYKSCQNCGVTISEFVAPLLRPVNEIEDPANTPLPSLVNSYVEELRLAKLNQSPADQSQSAGSKISWLFKRCRNLKIFSPGKRDEQPSGRPNESSHTFSDQLNEAAFLDASESPVLIDYSRSDNVIGATEASESERFHDEPEPSHAKEDTSMAEPETGVKEVASEIAPDSVDMQDNVGSLPPLPEKTSASKKPKAKKRGRGKAIKRTRSVQAVVEESAAVLKEPFEEDKPVEDNNPLVADGASEGDLIDGGDKGHTGAGIKRHHAEISVPTGSEVDGSVEAHSESISLGGRRKRRQTVASGTSAGGRRYNLRKSTIQTNGAKAVNKAQSPTRTVHSKDDIEADKAFSSDNNNLVPPLDGEVKEVLILQSESIEVCEPSSQKQPEDGDKLESNRHAEAAASSTPENDSSLAEGYEDDSEEDSDSEKHSVTLPKKIWNFLTS